MFASHPLFGCLSVVMYCCPRWLSSPQIIRLKARKAVDHPCEPALAHAAQASSPCSTRDAATSPAAAHYISSAAFLWDMDMDDLPQWTVPEPCHAARAERPLVEKTATRARSQVTIKRKSGKATKASKGRRAAAVPSVSRHCVDWHDREAEVEAERLVLKHLSQARLSAMSRAFPIHQRVHV